MRLGRLVVFGAGAFVFLLLTGGCEKPKEGAKCDAKGQTLGHGPGECIDKGSALVCVEGTFQKVKCDASPIGCKKIAGSVSCNVITDEGEPCTSEKKVACSTDNKKMLDCVAGKWKMRMPCSRLCVDNVEGVRCENAEGKEGDPCTAEQKDQGVCSPDKQKLLVCDGSKMAVASTCRGQNHCRPIGKKLDCDISMAEIDDPCEEKDHMSCDTAKKTLLKCDGKKFVKVKSCKVRCNNAFDKYSCS